jgi:16S rRNA (guanine966-N2)-methyltransferase
VRVVSGTARGRRLQAPAGRDTRPTSDRVREATFNALHSLGVVEGASVVDLFAGSGAMGIEALSRGAAGVTFVDRDPRAVATIRQNLARTGFTATATVVRADAGDFLAGVPRFDLAIVDPPYATTDEEWAGLLARLDAGVAVLESDRPVEPGPEWGIARVARYGDTVVTFTRHPAP